MPKKRQEPPPEEQHDKIALERGLPAAVEAERFILGSILVSPNTAEAVLSKLKPQHFALDVHQKIFRRMVDLNTAGEMVDHVMLSRELLRFNELEAVGGLAYIISLDDGLPRIANIEGYIRIVQDKAILRELISAGKVLMNSALLGTQRPEEIADNHAAKLDQITGGMTSRKTSFTFTETVEEAGGLNEYLAPRKDGIPTGFPSLDRLTGGLYPGLFYVIGGDSGHGKSALLCNIAQNAVFGNTGAEINCEPHAFGYFSLEMSKKSLYYRMLCAKARVSLFKLKMGFLNVEERRSLQFAAAEMASAPIYIDSTKGIGVREMRTRVKRMIRDQGIKVVGIDYLQLLNWEDDGKRSEYEGITYITRSLAEIAGNEGIPVIALSQFNQEYSRRKDKATRPTDNALHGSGSIKKDADNIYLLFKLSQAHPGVADLANRSELLLAKQREGRTGMVLLDFERQWTQFIEVDQDLQPDLGE